MVPNIEGSMCVVAMQGSVAPPGSGTASRTKCTFGAQETRPDPSVGGRRPLGIPALEDKIVQSAVGEALAAIYKGDFLDVSCGFQPGRSTQQARRGERRPATFDCLGLRYYCRKTRNGHLTVKRKTQGKRMTHRLKELRAGA